jgi:hypothetical protein
VNSVNFNFSKVLISAFFLSLISFSYGCATIVSGTSQSILVDTPHLKEASCRLTDSSGNNYSLASTPGFVTVQKGDGPMSIVCEKKGYEDGVLSVEEMVVGSTFGNILLGGGIGILVDAASGAAQEYPPTIVVWMKPYIFASKTEEEKWHDDKKKYDEAVIKKEKELNEAAY